MRKLTGFPLVNALRRINRAQSGIFLEIVGVYAGRIRVTAPAFDSIIVLAYLTAVAASDVREDSR
jgi:hypothetical protein